MSAGCRGVADPASQPWEADAPSRSVGFTRLAQIRVSPDRPLPRRLVRRLGPEYALLVVDRQSDWNQLCRRYDLSAQDAAVDLHQGPVVGLLAQVGERAEPQWPTRILSLHNQGGQTVLEASFLPGLYYPLAVAGYLELIQVHEPIRITAVRLDSRVFVLPPARD